MINKHLFGMEYSHGILYVHAKPRHEYNNLYQELTTQKNFPQQIFSQIQYVKSNLNLIRDDCNTWPKMSSKPDAIIMFLPCLWGQKKQNKTKESNKKLHVIIIQKLKVRLGNEMVMSEIRIWFHTHFFPLLTSEIIIHQTHYEKSDWSEHSINSQ